jgi:HK97 family phage major capsid protein
VDYITKLRTEYSTLEGEVKKLHAEIEKREKQEYSAEEQLANKARLDRMEVIKTQIDERTKFAKLALDKGEVTLPTEPEGKGEFQASKAEIKVGETKIDRTEFAKAANQWAVSGSMDRKFATITTATQSSILLPTGVANPAVIPTINAFREAYAAVGLSPMQTAGTGVLNVPVMTESGSGGAVAQTANSETEAPPTFGDSMVLTPETYQSGTAWVSQLQLGANDFDLLSFVQSNLELNKESRLEAAIAAALIADSSISQNVNCTSGAPTYANMASFNRSLPKRYDKLKVMILDGSVISFLEGITGSDGHPVLVLDPQNGGFYRFNGTPVLRCDSFADEATTEASCMGVVISMLGFVLRDAGQKQIGRYDVPARPGQIGLNLFSHHAFDWSVSAVSKLLA